MFSKLVNRWLVLLLFVGLFAGVRQSVAAWMPSDGGSRTPNDVPPNFEDTLVANISTPTGLAFTPDGRLLITTQPGQLRIYQNGTLLPTPALDLGDVICDNSERGLLGVTVDPDFASNHYIYVYYTFRKHDNCNLDPDPNNPVNRTTRFTLPDTNLIDPASEVVLVDNIITNYGNHNAGDLHFGADGYLYISIGDGGGGTDTRSIADLSGKIIRVHANDGTPVNSNPYYNDAGSRRCGDPAGVPSGNGPCQEIFARGLRNPFRFSFRPGTNTFYINDVGQNVWEEIDEGLAGADYGWDEREGPCDYDTASGCSPTPAGMTDPIFAYNHDNGCYAITGSAFVPSGVWPAPYDGSYLFADYGCGAIFRLADDGNGGYTAEPFVTNLGGSSAVMITFGPYNGTQALYYTNYWGAGQGQVRRIAYTGSVNQPPLAHVTAVPTYGDAPLPVTFDASTSTDPNGDPLTYDWDFGTGDTYTTSNPVTVYTYTANGSYIATLLVHDDQGGTSDPVSVRIDVGNTPPTPTITFPYTYTEFYVGQVLTLTGTAVDNEDGDLPGSALEWQAILHHINENHPENAHTHPFLGATNGSSVVITAPHPEDIQSTALSYLEIRLKATDSLGFSTVISQTLRPVRMDMGFLTDPDNLQLSIDDMTFTAPITITSWQNYDLPVMAPLQTDGNGQTWLFDHWSDGGGQSHIINTPDTPTTTTATFLLFTPTQEIWLPFIR